MKVSNEKIIVLNNTESTNNYAMAMVQDRTATDGTAVFAIEQNQGKGRLHRRWQSEPGKNIILSVITDMKGVLLQNQFLLSMIAALSVAELFKNHSEIKPFVKWPNDIFINDRKAGGILIETTIRGTIWQWAVTGFGININQSVFEDLLNATSLSCETGKEFNVLEMAVELKNIFLQKAAHLKSGNTHTIVSGYNEHLYKKGEVVTFETEDKVFEARIMEVTGDGKLITTGDEKREWVVNEVRMRV